jgi:hypothetical protein
LPFKLLLLAVPFIPYKVKNTTGIESELKVDLVLNKTFSENSIIDKPVVFKNNGKSIDISVRGVSGSVVFLQHPLQRLLNFL